MADKPQEDHCQSCGAEVYWIITTAGKRMICERRRRTVVTASGQTVVGYEPHWGNCPQSKQWKGKKRNAGT